jgi:hypothetical protein
VRLKLLVFGKALEAFVAFERRHFEKSCRSVRSVQEGVLLDFIRRNAGSEFGRTHKFELVKSVKDFQNALPVGDYDYFQPYVDRVVEGDEQALLGPGEKIVMFATTSGTTGKAKFIPITKTFVERYRKGSRIWGSYLIRRFPRSLYRKIMHSAAPLGGPCTGRGVPCGGISGLIAEMQNPIVRSNYAVPRPFTRIQDLGIRTYAGIRMAIAQDVGFFSASNPARILLHARIADERKEDIIRDLADGTCREIDKLERGAREELLPYIKKDPAGARRFERIVEKTGHLHPKDYWPNLDVIACWKGGPPKIYAQYLKRFFGDVPVWDVGLLCSEGRVTIPMDFVTSAGPLDIENNFFEFIPEEHMEDASPPTLLPHELEVGKRYSVLLTTCAGFYRYNLRDVLEVAGFFGKNPIMSFVNKGSRFLNIMGERISEYQAVSAMEKVVKEMGIHLEHFSLMLCAEEVPYYSLIIEEGALEEAGQIRRLMRAFDRNLRDMNMDYLREREAAMIGPVSVRIVARNSFSTALEQLCKERSGGMEQLKHAYLMNDEELLEKLEFLEEIFVHG